MYCRGKLQLFLMLSLALPLTFTGLNIRTVIVCVTWSNKYLHRIYEQDHFGSVHFKGHINGTVN